MSVQGKFYNWQYESIETFTVPFEFDDIGTLKSEGEGETVSK